MMKKTLIATALLAGSSAAMAEISGNVALVSDYAFRGVSQTDEQIAIQGGFDYAHDSGLYVGTWASNVDSTFFGGPRDPQIELDIYAGYAGEMANGIGYDVGILRYEYPGGDFGPGSSPDTPDTTELYASGSMAGFTVSLNYSDELAFVGSSESAWYLAAGYEMELPQGFGLALHVG
ncbi:MAG: TorF family putative porin, partial [Gammaproteobacteria bacterium]